jgi:hypothetical protein
MSTPTIPIPRSPVSIRPAAMSDLPFIDSLQKLHSKQVGWMPTKQLEERIKAGHVLLAEDEATTRIGYCIACDRYMKREDCGIIYQMNVLPGRQRGFVGATLLKAQFERSAYGCRLYCCWCAQDIAANRFWEAMGFIPLAYRAGSREKGRVHIFWQRRIRAGDGTTPYWFPSQTSGGSIREDRLVFPIPPGTHWGDAKPIVLPGAPAEGDGPKQLPKPSKRQGAQPTRPANVPSGALWFAPAKTPEPESKPKRERKPKVKVKNDPRLVAAARELRDRWLERVNAEPSALPSEGKYDVSRQLTGAGMRGGEQRLLAG